MDCISPPWRGAVPVLALCGPRLGIVRSIGIRLAGRAVESRGGCKMFTNSGHFNFTPAPSAASHRQHRSFYISAARVYSFASRLLRLYNACSLAARSCHASRGRTCVFDTCRTTNTVTASLAHIKGTPPGLFLLLSSSSSSSTSHSLPARCTCLVLTPPEYARRSREHAHHKQHTQQARRQVLCS